MPMSAQFACENVIFVIMLIGDNVSKLGNKLSSASIGSLLLNLGNCFIQLPLLDALNFFASSD